VEAQLFGSTFAVEFSAPMWWLVQLPRELARQWDTGHLFMGVDESVESSYNDDVGPGKVRVLRERVFGAGTLK
jgi:hypothetical protein